MTDANQHAASYTYDVIDRLASRTDPLQRRETFTYDPAGNPSQWTDRKGQVTTWTYDSLNRLHQITYADASTITYTYDARDRLTQIDDSASGSSIVRTYDDFDRPLSETTPQGIVSYTHDDSGRRATMTVQGQPVVNYGYDNASRLTGITRGTLSVTIGYDITNRRTTLTLPNGIVTKYGYDDGNQLTSLTYQNGVTTLGDLTYTYDSGGKRAQTGGSWARTGLPQPLASATYDAANELTAWGTQVRQYDANGSLAGDGLTSYTWNARQALSATSGLISEGFAYDAVGRRVIAAVATGSSQYLYDGLNAATRVQATQAATLLSLGGLDEWVAQIDSSGTRSVLTDALGSTVAVSDTNGNLLTQHTYDPFGATVVQGDSGVSLRFTGREQDDSDSYYFRARYYQPNVGRFISEDPVDRDLNVYVYARSNPVTFVDRLGLKPGDPYPTVDAAAIAALQEFNPKSIENDREFGGSIYCDGGKYEYTEPNMTLLYSDFVYPSRPPAGKKLAGEYHTHGRNGILGLSTQDKQRADAKKVPSYVGAPNGWIIKYDPAVGVQVSIGFTRVPK